jgi:DnaJ domain
VTQDQFRDKQPQDLEQNLGLMPTYYDLLDLASTATLEQIRRAYRLKSKLYHPDTTTLPREIAIQKFRELNKAYAILSNPEHRTCYDAQSQPFDSSGFSNSIQTPLERNPKTRTSSAGLDPTERPLSPGELFALFLLGVTFLVCLVVAIVLGIARGEMVLHSPAHATVPKGITPALGSHTSPQQAPSTSRLSHPSIPEKQLPTKKKHLMTPQSPSQKLQSIRPPTR